MINVAATRRFSAVQMCLLATLVEEKVSGTFIDATPAEERSGTPYLMPVPA